MQVTENFKGLFKILLAIFSSSYRNRYLEWGTQMYEVEEPLLGDGLLDHVSGDFTQAITINTSAQKVWPWLIQIGERKAGFYTYDLIEHALGGHLRNTTGILKELQHLAIDDTIHVHPLMDPLSVKDISKPNFILLKNNHLTWVFILRRIDAKTTRLLVRARYANANRFKNSIAAIMQHKMLENIKSFAEFN